MPNKFYIVIVTALMFGGASVYAKDKPSFPVLDGQVHEGVATCASSNCHGSVKTYERSNILHNEYITWERKDVHSQAYKKMFGKAFTDITKKLGLKAPSEEPACLVCHSGFVPKKLRGKKFQMEDGIGCETCHGGSEKWLASHASKEVKHNDNLAKGLFPADDIVERTRLCLSCHYGNSQQFVSHEIMGAGHPRISFEMDTFSELQPPHFVQDDDYKKRKTTYSNAKLWAVGQAIAAESVLAMLKSSHMQAGKLFPELSLFDCHSCHHPMSDKSWSPRRGTGLGPGVVPINDSSLLMLRHVIVPMDAGMAWKFRESLKELHRASTENYTALSVKVTELQAIVSKMQTMIVAHTFSVDDIQAILQSLINEGIWGEYKDYVAAEQSVMAISSLTISWDKLAAFTDARRTAVRKDIDTLYKLVANEEAYDQKRFGKALRILKDRLLGN